MPLKEQFNQGLYCCMGAFLTKSEFPKFQKVINRKSDMFAEKDDRTAQVNAVPSFLISLQIYQAPLVPLTVHVSLFLIKQNIWAQLFKASLA